MSYIETKIISLNASDANIDNSSFLSSINFNTTNLYVKDDDVINTYIEVANCQIPVSFYIINYTNNLLKFQSDTDPIETYTIPTGNYNASQLITLLNTFHTNLVLTFDKTTGKITFTHNKPFIIYNDFKYSIGNVLGFNSNTINTSVGTSNPYTLTPPNLLNLMGIKKINIFSSNIEITNYCSNNDGSTSHTSLLAVIPVDVATYSLINYHNYSNFRTLIKNNSIDNINLQLKDENNNLINFNGISYTITLLLHIERKLKFTDNIPLYNLIDKFNEKEKININEPKIKNELDLLTQ